MTRQEFSGILRESRKLSGIKSVDLVIKLHKGEAAISNLVNDRFDSMMDKLMELIDAIDFVIVISKKGVDTPFFEYKDLHKFTLEQMNKLSEQSTQEAVAEVIGINKRTYIRYKKGGSIRLSVFLKALELNHYTLRLDAKIL